MNHEALKKIIITMTVLTMFPVFVMVVGPKFPATEENISRSNAAASMAAASLSTALQGNTVSVDRRFGDNLNLYLHRNAFEQAPADTRDAVVQNIVASWCKNAELPWLPRVALYDIDSGARLATHHCVFGNFGDVLQGALWN